MLNMLILIVILAQIYRDPRVKNPTTTHNLAQEYQAIKRQKLEGGKTRQVTLITLLLTPSCDSSLFSHCSDVFFFFSFFSSKCQILNVKPQNLPHKGSSNLCPSTAKTSKEDRKVRLKFLFIISLAVITFSMDLRMLSHWTLLEF